MLLRLKERRDLLDTGIWGLAFVGAQRIFDQYDQGFLDNGVSVVASGRQSYFRFTYF